MVPRAALWQICYLKCDAAEWKQAIVENILSKTISNHGVDQVKLIRNRLQTMSDGLWRLVRDGSKPVATHAVFAATIHYPCLRLLTWWSATLLSIPRIRQFFAALGPIF